MNDIRQLEPKPLWGFFHEITQIPRPSKKEKIISEYVVKFAKDHKLETIVDKVGNVIIQKTCNKRNGEPKGCHLSDSSRYGSSEEQR